MARPTVKGLLFYKKSLNFYDDFRIIDLLEEYGPLGVAVYEVILTMVYREGYYIEAPIQTVAAMVLRTVGNRWAKKERIIQVIRYCASIGLFDENLLAQNVITSEEIQRRYDEIAARRKVDKEDYWLLGDERSCENTAENEVNETQTPVFAAETRFNASDTLYRKDKNKDIDEDKKESDIAPPAVKNNYGKYQNVLLTGEELEAFKSECSQWEKYIERLSEYMASKGDSYKSHLATLRSWYSRDNEKENKKDDGLLPPSYDIDKYNARCLEPLVYKGRKPVERTKVR